MGIESRQYLIEGSEYEAWSNDDKYIIALLKQKIKPKYLPSLLKERITSITTYQLDLTSL
jgi:hypothetical protein